ncbi:hypothetical protein [Sorangium atrum]|uniref:Uncharacterized protein n=1 Tax=Sorangium atrum TaxID=2995308 RepID=A0ABT5C3G3_9BACT|nr:hypothetical protein [Sorangium aterium]MDC0680960.1 hypothetical protein [Sorangium aterium]
MASEKKKKARTEAASDAGTQGEKPSAEPQRGGKKKSTLTAAQRQELLDLDPAYEAPIDHPVSDTLQEARELEVALSKLGKEIYKKSRLSKEVGTSISARRDLLAAAESAWTEVRTLPLSSDLRAQRKDAEALKRDAIAALRYFLAADEEVERRVDGIVLGTGVADLVSDLSQLAELLEQHRDALARADLPKRAPERARELAAALSSGAAERAVDPQGNAAMALRNRAFWWLREAMDDIRAAGRYVYRDERKVLALFRTSSARARARRRAVKQDEPETTGSSPTPAAPEPEST